MLLPAGIVAETIAASHGLEEAGSAAGCIVDVCWKNMVIPVVDMAALLGAGENGQVCAAWLAIIIALGDDLPWSHYALPLLRAPQLAPREVIDGDVQYDGAGGSEFTRFRVRNGDLWLIVPDLERIEQWLVAAQCANEAR